MAIRTQSRRGNGAQEPSRFVLGDEFQVLADLGQEPPPASYQLKISLLNISPLIWRRVIVPVDLSLARLHQVIQRTFAWEDYHLHDFEIDGERFEPPDDEDIQTAGRLPHPEKDALLIHLVEVGDSFKYEYDFGDGWVHTITVEKKLPPGLPIHCLAGRRAGPPEDCGGPYGYPYFLQAYKSPKHENHHDYLAMVGPDFDPARCDLEEINQSLAPLNRTRTKHRQRGGVQGPSVFSYE